MGLRSRLKGRIKKALGADAPATTSNPTAAPVPPVRMKPTVETVPAQPVPADPPPKAVPQAVSVAHASPQSDTQDGPKPISEEKVKKHLLKTRKGVLKMVLKAGGTSSLAEMHDFSERRYFIAHKKFSDLMEAMIEDGHIDYDHGEGRATLTEKGKAFAEG